jgi:DNA-binding MarR family transcriptional regulator
MKALAYQISIENGRTKATDLSGVYSGKLKSRLNWRKKGDGRTTNQRTDEPFAYASMLSALSAGRNVRAVLARLMGVGVFSEAQLATLIALHAVAPSASTVAALCSQTDVSRPHMILVIDSLVARGLLVQGFDHAGRRQGIIRLTGKGREAAVVAGHLFLEAVDEVTPGFSPCLSVALYRAWQYLASSARRIRG